MAKTAYDKLIYGLPPHVQNAVDEAVLSFQEPQHALSYILDTVLRLLNAEFGSLRMYHRCSDRLKLRAVRRRTGEEISISEETGLPLDGPGIVSQVARQKSPILVTDLTKEPKRGYVPLDPTVPMRSELAVPILSNNRDALIGVLNVESPEPAAFGQTELAYLEAITHRLRVTIQRSQLLEAIQEIGSQVLQMNQKGLLASTVCLLCDLMLVSVCSIWLFDEKQSELVLKHAIGRPVKDPEAPDIRISLDSFVGQVVKTREPVVTIDVLQEASFHHRAFAQQQSWVSAMAVPILSAGENMNDVQGVIFLCSRHQARHFSQYDVNLAMVFSNQVAIALKQMRMLRTQEEQLHQLQQMHLQREQKAKQLRVINKILVLGAQLNDIDTLLDKATAEISTFLGYKVDIGLVERDKVIIKSTWYQSQKIQQDNCEDREFEYGKGIIGTAAQAGHIIIVPDVSQDARYFPCFPNTRSEMTIPLSLNGSTIGVLNVESENLNAFGSDEVALFEGIASNLVVIIEKAQFERRYKRLYDSARDAIIIFDLDGTIQDVNAEMLRLSGFTEAALIGKNIAALATNSSDAHTIRQRIHTLADGETVPISEFYLKKEDGSAICIETNPTPITDEQGRALAIQSIWRDVTERKRNEEAIHRHNTLLEALLELSQAPFRYFSLAAIRERAQQLALRLFASDVCDVHDLMVSSNHKASRLIRLTPLLTPDWHNPLSSSIQKVAQTGNPLRLMDMNSAMTRNDSDGAKQINAFLAVPMIVQGRVAGVISLSRYSENAAGAYTLEDQNFLQNFAHHLTLAMEYIRLAEQQRKQHAATKVLQEVSLVGGFLSHKLGNLLGGAALTIKEIKHHLEDIPPTAAQLMSQLENISLTAAHFVQQLRDMGKPVQSKREKLHIQPLLEKIIDSLSISTDVQISLSLHQMSPVLGDRQLLLEVFEGLIRNGIDAMPDGGNLLIQGNKIPDTHEISLSFKDTGRGIAPALQEQIFTPFFTTKTEGRGMGIGLWLTRLYIQTLGGDIQVHSEIGHGTQFILHLPIVVANLAPNEDEADRNDLAAPNIANAKIVQDLTTPIKRILIVEDDQSWQDSLAAALQRRRVSFKIAPNYTQAVQILAAKTFDAYIVDIRLIDYDGQNHQGLDLVTAILARRPQSRVIILSGLDDLIALAKERFGSFEYVTILHKLEATSVVTLLDRLSQGETG